MSSKWPQYVYLACAGLFVVGILAQVFLVGLSLMGAPPVWDAHIMLGHSLGGAALLMVIFAYLGRLPHPFKRFTWLAFAIYVVMADGVIFLRGKVPVVAALHPVLALLLFALTTSLVWRAWRLVRESSPEVVAEVAGD